MNLFKFFVLYLVSKCDVGNWIFSKSKDFFEKLLGFVGGIFLNFWGNFLRFFLEDVFGGMFMEENFLGRFFWDKFFWRIFLGEIFLEEFFLGGFFGKNFLGGTIWEDFLGGIFCLYY